MDRAYAAELPVGAACSWKLVHPALPLLDAPVITPVLEAAPEKLATMHAAGCPRMACVCRYWRMCAHARTR